MSHVTHAIAYWFLLITHAQMLVPLGGSGPDRCELNGQIYSPGDRWHPLVEPFGIMHCVNCSCAESGRIHCTTPSCPSPQCPEPQIPEGECCPACPGATLGQRLSSTHDDLDPILPETDPERPCRHDDVTYRHQEVFSTFTSGIRPRSEHQCVLCTCLDSEVFCHLKTCPEITCSEPVYVNTDCCLQCLDSVESVELDHIEAEDKLMLEGGGGTECRHGDRVHLNGTSWHPTVGPFGHAHCVVCQCQSGRIRCGRVGCGLERRPPCDANIRVPGHCCTACVRGNSLKKKLQKRLNSRKSKMRGISNSKSRDRNSLYACAGSSDEALVLMTSSERVITLAFDVAEERAMAVYYVHLLPDRRVEVRQHDVTRHNYWPLVAATTSSDVTIEGVTKRSRLVKFKKKLTRLRRCKKPCPQTLPRRLLKMVRPKAVPFRSSCKRRNL